MGLQEQMVSKLLTPVVVHSYFKPLELLTEAERLFISAARSRPSHAATWLALAELRTRKLRHGPQSGRRCYHTTEGELKKAGLEPSYRVYTALTALEW